MKVKSKSGLLTAFIVILIIIFAALILFGIVKRSAGDRQVSSAGQSSGGAPSDGQPPAQAGQGSSQAARASAVRVKPVEIGTIENSVMINGDVLARNQVAIYPTMAGKLTELRLGIGDAVNRNAVVALVDPSRPGEVYSLSPVLSTVSGTVIQAPYSPGDTVTTASAVYVVGDLSSLVLETFVPERFTTSVKQGLAAQVTLEALPGEIFAAAVDEVSPVLDPASRTLKIKLRFLSRDDRIKAGMFATVSLVTSTRTGVPVIPRISVINTYGSWIVFIVNEKGLAERREVLLGLESEELVEVSEGLKSGERIVIEGQNFLSDGDPVRIVE
jgi:multidrug efflux pump subunit AcrA (membrane-fusion protein)